MAMENTAFAEQYPLLSKIDSPEDLKALPKEDLDALAQEIRSYLVLQVTENGGHLASNLGAVELSLAIHRVFSTPKDHVIFDVGHQSYIHKLVTGRREAFSTLRQGGGISGFPKRSESEHDCFGTGHSSTSLSAALGFAEADRLSGSDAYTVCVFGDGAYTGGMIHEALNNSRKDLRLIIVLNENEMSISKNIGRFAKELSHIRATNGYFRTKNATASVLRHIPLIGKPLFNGLLRLKMALKAALYGSNYFEKLGLYYLGPVDGNDEHAVEQLLRQAKESRQSCVIHLKTKKGKGYVPAEQTPTVYHGMAPASKKPCEGKTFSDELGDCLTEMASEDLRICAITAAMTEGTGLTPFRKTYPTRFFDVGIAEEHAVTFAAGLAANGYRPFVAIYSTFLQRAYDNVIHDVALQGLPVVFCIDRAGLNAADGATHHGIFDVAFLSQIPNLKIYTPATLATLRLSLQAALASDGPVAIRYPSGCENQAINEAFYRDGDPCDLRVRASYELEHAPDAVIITHGRMAGEALKACEQLKKRGTSAGVLLLEQLTPYDALAKALVPYLTEDTKTVLFLEEEIRAGGMGMLLHDALNRIDGLKQKKVRFIGLESFGVQAKDEPIHASFGMDAASIVKRIEE